MHCFFLPNCTLKEFYLLLLPVYNRGSFANRLALHVGIRSFQTCLNLLIVFVMIIRMVSEGTLNSPRSWCIVCVRNHGNLIQEIQVLV